MARGDSCTCPVCYYPMLWPPSEHNICLCCGTEFGYDDLTLSHEQLRADWVSGGMKWWSKITDPPPGWDPIKQLRRKDAD